MIASVFIPHGGCPERCRFCDQKVSGGEVASLSKVRESLETQFSNITSSENEIAFYGGTFTALSQDLQKRYLEVALEFIRAKKADSIRISTRPDAIDESWLKILRDEYFVRIVELGVQTFNEASLFALGRTHTLKQTEVAIAILKKLQLKVGLHFMIGVPNERLNEDQILIAEVIRLAPDFVRLHPLVVIRDTALHSDFNTGKFRPISFESAVERLATVVEALESKSIQVIRIGLQANDVLSEEVIAGPYHPALGEFVRSKIMLRSVEKMLENTDITHHSDKTVTFDVPERLVSQFRGQKSENIKALCARFNLPAIEVNVLKEVQNHGTSQIRIRNTTRPSERG